MILLFGYIRDKCIPQNIQHYLSKFYRNICKFERFDKSLLTCFVLNFEHVISG